MLDVAFIGKAFIKQIGRVPYTLYICLVSIAITLLLSIVFTMIRVRKFPILDQILAVYISFFRSTPGVIHILLIYYGLPLLLNPMGLNLGSSGKGFYAIAALSLANAASLTETLRPVYLSIDKGQHEAALCAGLSSFQKEVRIILPQVIPIALPVIGNAMIELFKDTSILFVIGVVDIMGGAKNLISNSIGIHKTEIYIAVGLIYLMITTVVSWGNQYIEKKCSHITERTVEGKGKKKGKEGIMNEALCGRFS